MAIDPSIALSVTQPKITAPDPIAQYGQVATLQNLLNTNRTQQQAFTDDQSARQALSQSGGDMNQYIKNLAASGSPTQYAAAIKNQNEAALQAAQTSKASADAGKANSDVTNQAIARHRDQLANINTPQDATAWVQSGYQDPITGPILQSGIPAAQAVAQIPIDPTLFNQWKQQAALGATKYIEQNKPTYQTSNLGGKTVTTALPGLGGAPTTVNVQANSQSPDSIATNATSRANNAATIAKDYTVAGIGPNGSILPQQESEAQMIADGKLPPLSGFALARPGGSMIMSRVQEINPDYDATTYGAKAQAAKAFTTGPQGNAMRSFAVAGQHLDQLGSLVDALDNGNTPAINSIAQTYAKQTGNPAPTNFDAAKDIVSKEVIKAIVAGGGGVSERAELANLMSKANSPAQLKGVISTYSNLMGAQHDALLQQRQAAGLSDSTLPNYSASPTATPTNQVGVKMAIPIKTAADYAKLQSGATYIDPQGQTRQKP